MLDQAFIVTFLQAMDEKSVKDAVTLVDRETGKSFPTKLAWNKDLAVLTIEPVGRYKVASFYDRTISEEARASDGGKLKQGLTLKFGTIQLPGIVDIFPNPNSGTFSIELPEAAFSGMVYRLVGLTGQMLREQLTETRATIQTVEASDLHPGLYFLQVVSEGRIVAVEKFVKQ